MTARSVFWPLLVLAPAYALVALLSYWGLVDTTPPVDVTYQHPFFTEVPVVTRADAESWEIKTAQSGQTVYRYEEYCLHEAVPGTVRKQWVNGFVYALPDKRNAGHQGCFKRSFAERLPDVTKPTKMRLEMKIDYRRNPLSVVSVDFPPVEITVLP